MNKALRKVVVRVLGIVEGKPSKQGEEREQRPRQGRGPGRDVSCVSASEERPKGWSEQGNSSRLCPRATGVHWPVWTVLTV